MSPRVMGAVTAVVLSATVAACTADADLIGQILCGIEEAFGTDSCPDPRREALPKTEEFEVELHPLPPLY